MTAAGLERRYRRLLWAYPSDYRRRHGAEIVTTLVEMAEGGASRPGLGTTLHLAACGLRQRFRLPARRPFAVAAAVLTAIVLGALGAVGGTWLGWRTAADLPSDQGLRAMTASLVGSGPGVAVYPQSTTMRGPAVATVADGNGDFSGDRVRAGLTAAGWRVTSLTEANGATRIITDSAATPLATGIPTRFADFTATKDGLSLRGYGSTVIGGAGLGLVGDTTQRLDVWADETAAVRPLTIAGLVAGALAGWLLSAALAYRARSGSRSRRRAATVLTVTALMAAAVPGYVCYRQTWQVLTYPPGSPYPYGGSDPAGQIAPSTAMTCAVIAVLALAALVLVAARGASRGPEPVPEAVTS